MDYEKKQVEFIGVEAGGPEKNKKHAAPLTYGSKIGILHGAAQYVNQMKMVRLKRQNLFLQDLIIQVYLLCIVFLKILEEQDTQLLVMRKH